MSVLVAVLLVQGRTALVWESHECHLTLIMARRGERGADAPPQPTLPIRGLLAGAVLISSNSQRAKRVTNWSNRL